MSMNKIKNILILIFVLVILYRFLFCYRIISFSNSGDYKYKSDELIYFPQPPFSIINPFKVNILKQKIFKFIQTQKIKNEINSNSIIIKSIKYQQNLYLILVNIKNTEQNFIFYLDIKTDKIINYK